MVIKRGQIWVVNFEPAVGSELHKRRPAVIISTNELNQYHSGVIVIPISTKTNYPGPERVSLALTKTSGLEKSSVALPAEIRAIDKTRLIKNIGRVSTPKLQEIEESLKLVLGLIEPD